MGAVPIILSLLSYYLCVTLCSQLSGHIGQTQLQHQGFAD